MDFKEGLIDYESFGAKGDGVTDDMPAICEAHAYANAHGLSVRTKPGATYHLGGQALTCCDRNRYRLEHLPFHDRRHTG